MKKPRLSAFLITHNEEENLPDCLKSLSFCDEIIVLDHASTDNTVKLATVHGALVFETVRWVGFGPQKQIALEKTRGDWVLSIDADERITEALQEEILAAITSESHNTGFRLQRVNFFLGKRMRFGGWGGDTIVRLARRNKCQFSRDLVHERMIVEGKIATLSNPLLHYSYRTLDDILLKQSKYALANARLRKERKLNSGVLLACTKSLWCFTRAYLLQLGFVDGRFGFVAAVSKSQQTFWKSLGLDLAGKK